MPPDRQAAGNDFQDLLDALFLAESPGNGHGRFHQFLAVDLDFHFISALKLFDKLDERDRFIFQQAVFPGSKRIRIDMFDIHLIRRPAESKLLVRSHHDILLRTLETDGAFHEGCCDIVGFRICFYVEVRALYGNRGAVHLYLEGLA